MSYLHVVVNNSHPYMCAATRAAKNQSSAGWALSLLALTPAR